MYLLAAGGELGSGEEGRKKAPVEATEGHRQASRGEGGDESAPPCELRESHAKRLRK